MRLELQLGLESMDYPGFDSASTGRRRRTGSDDLLRPGARATRGSKGPRVNTVASADEQVLGCSVPRRGRTRGTGGPATGANTWQTSRVLQLVLLEDEDEREALEALCFLSASSCQLERQAVQPQLASTLHSPKQMQQQQQQQQGQHGKGSSFTAEAVAAPKQLSAGWLAAAGGARQPSPGSDVSSDGCQGALAAPEQQQQQQGSPLDDIHPGAHPVDVQQLAPAGTQQLQQAARNGSWMQQQAHVGQVLQHQQQQYSAAAFEPLASLHSEALLAVQRQQAVHAPVAAVGLHQPLLHAQLASLLQASSYGPAAAAAAAGLSSAVPLMPLQLQQQPQQQPGLPELLGLLSVGLPHAAVQQQQLPLLPVPVTAQQQPPPVQSIPVAVKRPAVKGCYWHVYIANMIAAGRREQEAKEQQQQVGGTPVTNSPEQQQQQQQQALAWQRKSSPPRPMDAADGGSPCKRQRRQDSPGMQQQQHAAILPQRQLPPAPPLPNWLAAAGVLPPGLALAAAAAAAAASQASMLPGLLQAHALPGPLAAVAAASSMGLLGQQGAVSLPLPLLGMPAAASLGAGPSPELLLQLLSQQHGADGAAAVRPAPGIPAGMPLGGIAPGLLQGGGFAAGALLQALAAPGMGLVAQQ